MLGSTVRFDGQSFAFFIGQDKTQNAISERQFDRKNALGRPAYNRDLPDSEDNDSGIVCGQAKRLRKRLWKLKKKIRDIIPP